MIVYDLETELIQLPEIQAGKDVWQNKIHEFDVYRHTLECVRHIKDMTSNKDLIAAAYLHDIGKPIVKRPRISRGGLEMTKEGKPYQIFTDHEKVGEERVRRMNSKLFLKYELDQDKIARLVGAHGLPVQGLFAMREVDVFSRFQERYVEFERAVNGSEVSKEELMILLMADTFAHCKGAHPDLEELTELRNSLLYGKSNLRNIFDIQQKNDYSSRKVD